MNASIAKTAVAGFIVTLGATPARAAGTGQPAAPSSEAPPPASGTAPALPPGPTPPSPSPGLAPGPPQYVLARPHHHFLFGDSGYRSPGAAVALSLTPMPVDFGNLYAENIGWGVFYSSLELAVMAPMMWLAADHMGMGHGSRTDREWTATETTAMAGLVGGYVAVKLVAGLHAGHAAARFNLAHENLQAAPAVYPVPGGAAIGFGCGF